VGVKKFPVWPGKILATFGSALLCIQLLIDIGSEVKNIFSSSAEQYSSERDPK
jgi:hypothetical protein